MRRNPKKFSSVLIIAVASVGSTLAHADVDCNSFGDGQMRGACNRGRFEGERSGSDTGSRAGRVQGYLNGFAQGLSSGVNQGQNDSAYYAQGQNLESSVDSQMASGLQDANNQGAAAGSSQGTSDAIGRFQNAVNSGQVPSSAFQVPGNSFSPNSDSFEAHVRPIQNAGQIMQSRYPNPVLFDWDNGYGDMGRPTAAQLYQSGPNFDIGRGQWIDGDRGFDQWGRQNDGCNRYPTDYIPNGSRPDGGDGHGDGDGDGQHGGGKPPGTTAPAPVAPAPVVQSVNLRDLCMQSFKETYRDSSDRAFGNGIRETLSAGQRDGFLEGLNVGQSLSQQKGESDTFNSRFMQLASQENRDSFSLGYSGSFQSTYQDYLSHPKLNIAFTSMVDEAEGILEPGETFSAHFTVTNVGGKSETNIPVTVDGSGVVNAAKQTISIVALKSAEFTAHNIGTINPALSTNQTADVQLLVGDQSAELESKVQHILAVAQPSAQNDYLNGTGFVTVSVKNIATANAYGGATAELYVDNQRVDSKNIGILKAQTAQSVTLSYKGQDPYALLMGGHSAMVTVVIGSVEMDRNTVSLDPDLATQEKDLVLYFDQVANGKGIVPVGVEQTVRLTDLRNALEQLNETDVQGHRNLSDENVWGNANVLAVLQLLAKKYQGGGESAAAKSQYDQVAHAAWARCSEFQKNGKPWGDKRSDQEKSYGDLCHKIASSNL